MEKVSNSQQSIPLWERQSSERGHKTSVDKAVAAHRNRVDARKERTEARLNAAREINDRFFPKPQYNQRVVADSQYSTYEDEFLEQPAIQIDGPIDNVQQQPPLQVADLYEQLAVEPVREHAVEIIEKDSIEVGNEVQSDEVPKGSYVDYNV